MSITLIIIIATCIISISAFSREKIIDDLIFDPPAITYRNQWYRFFTCGFIHADYMHLGFNMYSFYMFGDAIEYFFGKIFGESGRAFFLILYISSLFFCLIPTYLANKNNYHYRSLGASGAVSAIVFAYIFLAPTTKLQLLFLPIPFPAFLFGIIYLIISAYLSKKGTSNINHSAHFWGAIYGIVFLIAMCNVFSHFKPINNFIDQLQVYFAR
ncbi:MAG: rhomboid family intramembrane serine protease [Bacteroidetes bacterium]|nr:rhomboid family intramembrane serine protease [Bacteroidota bacterium]MBS1670464.1 rhomboid family intramembrane serine protease [Bacteroidota bacterium]